jgi:hypothetical protein
MRAAIHAARFLTGSVSEAVEHHAHCSVEVVGRRPDGAFLSSIRSFTLALPRFAGGGSYELLFVLPKDAQLAALGAEKPAHTRVQVQFSRDRARDNPLEFRRCRHPDLACRR